jgi:hypothetical protein
LGKRRRENDISELSGEITLENLSPDRYRSNWELATTDDQNELSYKLRQSHDKAFMELTSGMGMAFDPVTRKAILRPSIAAKAGAGPYEVELKADGPNHFSSTLKLETLQGEWAQQGRNFKFTASVVIRVDVTMHPTPKGKPMTTGKPEPVNDKVNIMQSEPSSKTINDALTYVAIALSAVAVAITFYYFVAAGAASNQPVDPFMPRLKPTPGMSGSPFFIEFILMAVLMHRNRSNKLARSLRAVSFATLGVLKNWKIWDFCQRGNCDRRHRATFDKFMKHNVAKFALPMMLWLVLVCCTKTYTQEEIDMVFESIVAAYGVKIVYEIGEDFYPTTYEGESVEFDKIEKIDGRVLCNYRTILPKAFEKYPESMIRQYLTAIHFAKIIRHNGLEYAGTYDASRRIIYLANDGKQAEKRSIGTFHHEFSSALLKNGFFFLNLWLNENPEGFKYRLEREERWEKALDGTSLLGTEEDYEKGFMNSYGQTDYENDVNEYSKYIFTYPEQFKEIMDHYPRVRAKFLVWLEFYHEIDPIFTEDYFFNGGCASCEEAAASCGRWLTAALREVEAAPLHERSKAVLRELARGCPYLDARLRLFAERALLRSDAQGRATILVRGVTPLLPADAPAFAPEAKADGLAERFPLTIAGELPAHLPKDLFAGTYLYAWALENQLTALDLYNADARKLVRALLLSAAEDHEEP